MRLPSVEQPERYRGLYLYDFGEWTALGYTAEEIAVLLEQPEYADGKVYRIHNARPDGTMELAAVARERFDLESGMFFFRQDPDLAADDYDRLLAATEEIPAPCRARLWLVDRGDNAAETHRHLVSLVYPAEFDSEIAGWLLAVDYEGGDVVEGGISHVHQHLNEAHEVLRRTQLFAGGRPARSAEEILASVRVAVQR